MKKIIFIFTLFLSVLLVSCTAFMPQYTMISDQKNDIIDIFGVQYKNAQDTTWRPLFYTDNILIGTIKNPGGYHTEEVYLNIADEKKVFAITKVPYFLIDNGITYNYYTRADITMPAFNRSGIDALGLVDSQKKTYKVITDKELLNKLWDTLESTKKNNEDNGNFFPSEQELWFMNSNYLGIGIEFANGHVTLPTGLQWDIMEAGKSVPNQQ